MKANKGEWSEPYVALRLLGEGKLHLADDDGKRLPGQWLKVLDVIRYETKDRMVEYNCSTETTIDVSVDGENVVSVAANDFLRYAEQLKEEIIESTGNSFSVSDEIKDFFKRVEIKSIKARSVNKSDIFISTEDPSTSIIREHIGFSIKSKFGKDPTLFNTGTNSAAVYKLTNIDDELMNRVNNTYDDKGHTAVAERCRLLKENGCDFEFSGFPTASRSHCKTFEENLDLLNPRLGSVIDFVLKTHFLTESKARDVEDMVELLVEHNPCGITRAEEKYPYMMKSFLYASYCGLTAGTLWDGKSQVNGGFIAVDENGKVTANLAIESEGFKSYLFKHCYFEWPATSEGHGNYAKVYKENGEYFFRLNFQIRYR